MREAARTWRMAEAARVQVLKGTLDVSSDESITECNLLGHRRCCRQAPVSSPEAAFCIV
jgi:hypothetical protein